MSNIRWCGLRGENTLGFSRYMFDVPDERRELSDHTDTWIHLVEHQWVNSLSPDAGHYYRRQVRISQEEISRLKTRDEQQLQTRKDLMQKITYLTKQNIILSGINRYLVERQNEAVLIKHAPEFERKILKEDRLIKRHQRETRDQNCEQNRKLLSADVRKTEYICTYCIKKDEINERQRELNADFRNKLENLIQENSKLHKEVDHLHDEVESVRKQNVKINTDAEIKKKEYADIKKKLTQTNEENLRLKKKKESYENSSIQEKIRKLEKEAELQHGKIKSLNDELTHAKESALKNANECINLQKMLTKKNIEKTNLNAADEIQRKLREKISELEDKVNQLLVEKKTLTEQFRHEKDNELDDLYHENQNLKKQLIREKENFKLKEKEFIDMHQMMKTQKEHDLNLNATNVRTKQLDETNTELQNEIQRLLQEKSNMTDELKHEKEVRKKLEQYGNTHLQETNRTLRKENERLREDLTREKDNFKKMEVEFYKRSSDMKEKLEKQEQELVRLTTKLSEKSVLNRNVDPGAKKTQTDLQQQLDETRARLKNVQKELDDAKSRLSRAMGDRLTDNNPNIADLSDKNRPTKISERYQELYDNQWTDAFEIVNGACRNEENTINILRDILMDTLEFCKTQAANQMIQIRASFLKGEDLPANMNKQVKECRKAMAELYGKGLYREYCDQLRTSKPESMSTPSYVKECFEICWLMAVQDPPVEFGPDLHRGDTFNKEHYRAYTRSGERVDFVVWPVLLLHQNGPVLCKGVAQGK